MRKSRKQEILRIIIEGKIAGKRSAGRRLTQPEFLAKRHTSLV